MQRSYIFCVNTQYICSSTDENEWWPTPYCNLTTNYTNTSTFVSNVNTALNTLHVDIKNTSQGRFNTCVYGQSPNQIYAFLQCRGDATAEECYNCSQQAKLDVIKYCGNFVGSRVWSKFCFLRYNGNYNFTGKLDINGDNYYNGFNVSSDPPAYNRAAWNLLDDLSYEAANLNATDRYASWTTFDPGHFNQIYALAQCWGDISLKDCLKCLRVKNDQLFGNHSGRLGARGLALSCLVQYEDRLIFNPSPSTPTPVPSLPPTPVPLLPPTPDESSSKLPIILGILGGSSVLSMVCLFAIRGRLKSAIFGRRKEGHALGEDSQLRDHQHIPTVSNVFTVFKLETLVTATENFQDNNKLGEGGFGAVYKGITPAGNEIAVKKLSLKSMQGKREFLNEVKLVAKTQHRNLVKLLGCCTDGSERLLVYEYLANKSLDKILFDANKRRELDWHKRYNIIVGITRGLLYLHEDSHLRIIHRDIKAGNILLDNQLNPKIADFGLARLFDEEESHVNTGVAGTRGYMAPEYALQGQLSFKADVYSFGILLLELLSGRKSIDFTLSPELHILLEWAWRLYRIGNIVDMIDPAIIETCSDPEEALRCIHIGLLCTQANSSLRPSMSAVNLMLSTETMMLPDPTQPAFVSSVMPTDETKSICKVLPSNVAASITELVPR